MHIPRFPRNRRRPPPQGQRPPPHPNGRQQANNEDGNEQPRHNGREEDPLKGYKLKMPSFAGESDPDVYLALELKVEKIFRMKHYNEEIKVSLACLEFTYYANLWWEQVQNARQDRGDQ